jgi:hypothetical protein
MPGMCHTQARPVGYGMISWREGAIVADGRQTVAPHITLFPTGRTMSVPLPGISCLDPGELSRVATLVSSLRDKSNTYPRDDEH